MRNVVPRKAEKLAQGHTAGGRAKVGSWSVGPSLALCPMLPNLNTLTHEGLCVPRLLFWKEEIMICHPQGSKPRDFSPRCLGGLLEVLYSLPFLLRQQVPRTLMSQAASCSAWGSHGACTPECCQPALAAFTVSLAAAWQVVPGPCSHNHCPYHPEPLATGVCP